MDDMTREFLLLGEMPGVAARAWQAGDLWVVGQVMANEWYGELEGEHALLTACDQLLFNLGHATGAVVACDGTGGFLGVAMARWEEPRATDLARWDMIARELSERAVALGLPAVLRPGPSVESEGIELLGRVAAERGDDGVGEVELLLVAPGARGMGLGRRLFGCALAYLREHGATRYRLLTDDACDWGLYEHLGLERVGQMASADVGNGFMIYAYEGAL